MADGGKTNRFADWWWLRSPRNNNYNVANVNSDGTLNNNNGYNTTGGVRPDLPRLGRVRAPDKRGAVPKVRATGARGKGSCFLPLCGEKRPVGGRTREKRGVSAPAGTRFRPRGAARAGMALRVPAPFRAAPPAAI